MGYYNYKKKLGFYSDYLLKQVMLWVFVPCGLCFGHFGGKSCFHLQGCEKCCVQDHVVSPDSWESRQQVLDLASKASAT